MRTKLSFRQRLFLSFTIIFGIFTLLVVIFQFEREKNFRVQTLEISLDNITELTYNYIRENGLHQAGKYKRIDSLAAILPGFNVRLTIIGKGGTVWYDSEVDEVESMENHLDRPEVQESLNADFGANIRKSETTGNIYYYYVKSYPDYFIRTAALYNVQIRDALNVERIFIIYLGLLFIVISLAMLLITRRMSETITTLKDFSIRLRSGKKPDESLKFPNDELGVISSQIASIYWDLAKARQEISLEKEKLISHLDALNEGIAFFTPHKKEILSNQQFIQNLNMISETSNISTGQIFEIKEFAPVLEFIDSYLTSSEPISDSSLPFTELVLQIRSRYFNVKCMFFKDRSFEVVITETTKLEKRKLIKQQMTSNIAHELKTPVSSVLGYLETLQQKDIPKNTRKHFLERALAQAERLSDLIEDIATLNKIQEAGDSFVFVPLKIRKLVDEVHEHLKLKLDALHIKVNVEIPNKMMINGNASLLYSIFYNLFDNVIKYGGEHIEINLINYLEDKKYYYFSFSNTGNPIEEVHLPRLFERFYRIDDGRSRTKGGTGLGLAIVKNGVELHQGKISARPYKDGNGVEFLFSLRK
jgi:signal transduction histidine kinase